MTQINSREQPFPAHIMRESAMHGKSPEYVAAKHAIAEEVAEELDLLVDRLSDFLEMRFAVEFEELEGDITEAMLLRDENAKLKDEVSYLSLQLLAHATGQFSADVTI